MVRRGGSIDPDSGDVRDLPDLPRRPGDLWRERGLLRPRHDCFLATDTGLELVADTSTPAPGGSGTLTLFDEYASLDGETVAFPAYDGSGTRAIYLAAAGSVQRVADETLVLPGGGGGAFAFNPLVSLDAGFVSVSGADGTIAGIYPLGSTGSVVAAAEIGDAVPGAPGEVFAGFGAPSSRGGSVAFSASSGSVSGIYAEVRGTLQRIADTTTPYPGEGTPFLSFDSPATDADVVAFRGYNSGAWVGHGIFAWVRGRLTTVFQGTHLDGAELLSLEMGSRAVSGNRVTFLAHFTDGHSAIYVAELPPPPVPALPPVAGLLLALAVAVLGTFAVGRLTAGPARLRRQDLGIRW